MCQGGGSTPETHAEFLPIFQKKSKESNRNTDKSHEEAETEEETHSPINILGMLSDPGEEGNANEDHLEMLFYTFRKARLTRLAAPSAGGEVGHRRARVLPVRAQLQITTGENNLVVSYKTER